MALGLIFPTFVLDYVMNILAPMILDQRKTGFSKYLIDIYTPQLKLAIADAKIGFLDKFIIWKKFMGILMKCLVSFTYKEGHDVT